MLKSDSVQPTTAQSLGALLKSARDIMRNDKGLNGDLDRLPMLTWVMFLKFLDDLEIQREGETQLSGKKFKPAIEPPYRWRDWAAKSDGITGDELLAFINNEETTRPDGKKGAGLFRYLRTLTSSNGDDRRDVIATVFKGVQSRMASGYLLRDVINKLNGIHFTSSDELHTLGALYESMLREMRDAAGDSGEFYTPRAVVRFMVTVTDPRLGETVLDPASGTGGFLVEAYNHLSKQVKTVAHRQVLQEKSLFGCEPKTLPYLLCQMNLLLLGRRIVEFEQGGSQRAGYGTELLLRLSIDLTARFGRGFGEDNLRLFRSLYQAYPPGRIRQALPDISESPIRKSGHLSRSPATSESLIRISWLKQLADAFPLSWTHYVRLLRVRNSLAREFYETEALRGGWSVRQLDRQISTQFYERTALSRNKEAMLRKGQKPRAPDVVPPEEEIRDPLVLEFLGLKDEYSETDLEEALIRHLESFLLELGNEFAFVGRQKRLRIDHEWFRVDLLFFHRRLRSLVVIDLKTGPLSHADVGQMHLNLNFARAHWVQAEENPPVGLILCTEHGESLARYALEGLPNKLLVREYRTTLPSERILAAEIAKARRALEARKPRTK